MTGINPIKVEIVMYTINVQVCVAYEYQGKTLTMFPSNPEVASTVKVVYKEFPGWTEDIAKCKKLEELPKNCRDYVLMIQEFLGVHIKWIGVGSDRQDMITC